MSLFDELKGIPQNEWRYYEEIDYFGYEAAIADPLNFIESYFYYAGKNNFLYDSLYDFNQINNIEQNKRASHTVNTFFLGLYFKEKIDFLKPNSNSFLSTENNFVWAWFLCSLYHDAFFNINKETSLKYNYDFYSRGLLYNCDLIKRYYEKEKDPKTSHNNKTNYDHGIVSAEKLYTNYINMIVEIINNNPNAFEDFIANKDLKYCNLKINFPTLRAVCKIAKIIACHNIFNSKEATVEYNNLQELVKGDIGYNYMPKAKNQHPLNSYEKLYFLLALVDTLEPSKREIELKEIDIQVDENQHGMYDLHINLPTNNGERERYFNGISQLKDWLNFIDVSEDNRTIHINFFHNKNYLCCEFV